MGQDTGWEKAGAREQGKARLVHRSEEHRAVDSGTSAHWSRKLCVWAGLPLYTPISGPWRENNGATQGTQGWIQR